MPKKIMWLSKHNPTPRQKEELERLWPSHDLVVDNQSFDGADDIVKRFVKAGASELVVVAPLTVIRQLTRRGMKPIYAEMKQVRRGDPNAEVVGKYCYKFVQFHWCTGVKLELVPINSTTLQSQTGTEDKTKNEGGKKR